LCGDEPADIHFSMSGSPITHIIECKHLKKVTWAGLQKIWKKLNEDIKEKAYSPYSIVCAVIVYRENNGEIMVMEFSKQGPIIYPYERWKKNLV